MLSATSLDVYLLLTAPNTSPPCSAFLFVPFIIIMIPLLYAQMPMTLGPYSDWIKNLNDHAINGHSSWDSPPPTATGNAASATPPPPLICSLAAGLRGDLRYTISSHNLCLYSSAARRRWRRRQRVKAPIIDDTINGCDDPFVELASVAALAPVPRAPSTAIAKRQRLTIMRQEMFSDRKLRISRFLLEAAGRPVSTAREVVRGRRGVGREEGQHVLLSANSVNKTRRLVVLLAKVFGSRRCRRPDMSDPPNAAEAAADYPSNTVSAPSSLLPVPPPLELQRDIFVLMRPVYSLLGQALLGEPGPARRLECKALAAAVALSTAALEATPLPKPREAAEMRREVAGGGTLESVRRTPEAARRDGSPSTPTTSPNERRVAEYFAQVIALAVATKLDTFLAAMGAAAVAPIELDVIGAGDNDANGRRLLGVRDDRKELQGSPHLDALRDLGPREVDLERLLREEGAWDVNGDARGWPHNAPPPPAPSQPSGGCATADDEMVMAVESDTGGGQKVSEGNGSSDTPLSFLLNEVDAMVEAFEGEVLVSTRGRESETGEGKQEESAEWWRRVQGALIPRIAACRLLLARGVAGTGASGSGGRYLV